MRAILVTGALTLALSACATGPKAEIARSLTGFGLPQSQSKCVAERMDERLSRSQLRDVADLLGADRRDVGRMRIGDVADLLRGAGDGEVVEVMLRAGVGCAISG
ncbi:MAG: hypothetical protein WA979_13220 [Pacificimonas sp.]